MEEPSKGEDEDVGVTLKRLYDEFSEAMGEVMTKRQAFVQVILDGNEVLRKMKPCLYEKGFVECFEEYKKISNAEVAAREELSKAETSLRQKQFNYAQIEERMKREEGNLK